MFIYFSLPFFSSLHAACPKNSSPRKGIHKKVGNILSTMAVIKTGFKLTSIKSLSFSIFITHLIQKEGETPLRWSNKKINKL